MGTQLAPSAQAAHCPERHTIPAPHAVPFGWLPDSVQTEVPVAHEIAPVRHAFAGEQTAPAAQVAQEPPLHTMFVPQTVPFARNCCVSLQVATPSEQVVCPT